MSKYILPLLCIIIGYIFRTVMPYDLIIPFDLSQNLNSFLYTKTNLPIPWSETSQCSDFRKFVSIFSKNIPLSNSSGTEYFSSPLDNSELLTNGISAFDNAGIIKWRYKENSPYTAYPMRDNWTFRYYSPVDISVKQISDQNVPIIVKALGSAGFVESIFNNIPLYEYPSSHAKARKLGFTKDNSIYYVTIIEEPVNDQTMSDIRVSIDCGAIIPELNELYTKFIDIPHNYTNETAIIYAGSDNDIVQFNLLYPGTTITQLKNYWVKLKDDTSELIHENDNFLPCNSVENLNSEIQYFCFDSKTQEFKLLK